MKREFYFVFPALGNGLRSYVCESSKSWLDCARVERIVICNTGYNRCMKATRIENKRGNSTANYKKGCTTGEWCRFGYDLDYCEGRRQCEVDCCDENLCNAAAVPVACFNNLIASTFAVSLTVFMH